MYVMQAIKFSEEHSHGSLVALAIAIIAIFAAVNFNKVCTLYMCYLISTDQVQGLHIILVPE